MAASQIPSDIGGATPTSGVGELLARAPAFVAVFLGPDHRLAYGSPSMSALLGASPEQSSGRTLAEALPLAPPRLREIFDRVLASGETFQDREVLTPEARSSDGSGALSARHFQLTVVPLRSGGAPAYGLVAFALEVTDEVLAKERAEELERRYRFALDALPILAWTRDETGVEFVNRRWAEYTGADVGDPRAVDWRPFVHPDDVVGLASLASQPLEQWSTEVRYRRHDGIHRWHLVRSIGLRAEGGRITRRISTATDIDDQKRTEERQRFLADAAARLAASLDWDTTARAVVEVAVPAFTDWAVVHVANEDGSATPIAVAHEKPERMQSARDFWARYPTQPDERFGPAAVIRTQQSEWAAEITDEILAASAPDPAYVDTIRRVGFRSYITVPLLARGRSLGAITFIQAESTRRFTRDDVSIAEELGRRAALALDNAALYARERASARTVQRLQAVTASLVEAQGVDDVARVLCEQGREAVGVASVVVWSLEADHHLRLIASEGVPEHFLQNWRRIDAAALPSARALAQRGALWVEDAKDYREIDAALADTAEAAGRLTAFAALPLVVEGRQVGLVSFGYPGEHRFTTDEKVFIETVCVHAAQALERARSLDAERRSNERLRLLASVGELLSGSLDYRETLANVARVVVPAFADWCAVDLFTQRGIERVAIHHVDPDKVALAEELWRRYPTRPDSTGVRALVSTKKSLLAARVTEEMLRQGAVDEEHFRALASVGIGSVILAPLVVDERVTGVVTFIVSEDRHVYDAEDVRLADEIGRRASLAVSNAMLFRREQEARDRLSRLQDLTSSLAAAATPADVAAVATRETSESLGYASAVLYRTTARGLVLVAHHGLGPENVEALATVTDDAKIPSLVAVRTGEAVWIESAEQLTREYPDLVARVPPFRSVAAIPLQSAGHCLGVIAFGVPEDHAFPPRERVFVQTVAGQCAQALERASLLEREQRTSQRLAVLARAGEAFSNATDYEATLRNIVSVTVPELGDFAFFDVVESEGVRRIPAAHEDPETLALLEQTRWSRSERTDINLCALSSGKPAVHPAIDEAWMQDVAVNEGHLDLLRKLHLRSMLTVPLRARGRLLGALTLCYGKSGRSHDEGDMALAQELAARAATAIEQARLYEDARDSARRAEEASRIKDEFLATVSHELRTPLNAIVGWSALLAGDRLSDPGAVAKGIDVIQRNARAQARIIDDVLDVARIVSGKMKIDTRRVDLGAVVREAVDVVRPSADAKRVTLDVATAVPAPTLVGDPERLRQVAWNLLSNAVKFTDGGGCVRVRVAGSDDHAELVVEDTGRGISPAFLPYVFDRFRQADSSSTRAYGGLGLGLAIARHIVELHGGTIAAESEGVGRGATFRVVLPMRPGGDSFRPTSTGALPVLGTPSLAGRSVLVVDDDPDARDLLATLLESAGATIAAASSAAEALAVIATAPPDLVLSDIAMPGEDGHQLVQKLRALPMDEGGNAYAIALTAYARPEDKARIIEAGFDAHVAKPVDPAELLSVVSKMLSKGPRRS